MRKRFSEIDELGCKLEELDVFFDEKEDSEKKNKKKDIVVQKEWFFANLPEALIYEILVKVPPSSLYENCRLVCKLWKEAISRTEFIRRNMIATKSQLLIQGPSSSRSQYFKLKLMELDDDHLHYEVNDLGLGLVGQVRSSCNGFLLITSTKDKRLQLQNPLTKCGIVLPNCPSGCCHISCGTALVFDPVTGNYKVVHLYSDSFGFEILTVGLPKNSWRKISGPWISEMPPDFKWSDPVKINERMLYWHVSSSRCIISMDTSDEILTKIYLPWELVDTEMTRYKLIELGGCLSFVRDISDTKFEVWVMEGQVWSKRYSILADMINYPVRSDLASPSRYFNVSSILGKLIPVGCSGNGQVLVFKHMTSDALYVYWIKRRGMKKLHVKIKNVLPVVITHRSSIFCIKSLAGS